MGDTFIHSAKSNIIKTTDEENHSELVTITEKVSLTKNQHEVLRIICSIYEESVSHYMQEALVEAMRSDIEDGNFSDVLLERITGNKEEKINQGTNTSSFLNGQSGGNDLDADLQF